MPLTSLTIERFRNLEPVTLTFSPRLNLIVGANAAGKTSLLESLYVLGRARSFRTRNLDKLIKTGNEGFQLVAKIRNGAGGEMPVGISRSEKKLMARIDGKPVKRLSDLAALFPIQWLGGNLHRLIEEGPVYRRQYLDWGLFHVKPTYMLVWKRFQKLLKQRNASLRNKASVQEIQAWNPELAAVAEQLHDYRKAYVSSLEIQIKELGQNLLGLSGQLQVRYRKGWLSGNPFNRILEIGLDKDREHGFTGSGPHRADLTFHYEERPVNEQLSRGQQKLLIIGLHMAQAQLLKNEVSRSSLFLVDDLGSELDRINQERVMALLDSIEAQVFITTINESGLSDRNMEGARRFHVKHGKVSNVV